MSQRRHCSQLGVLQFGSVYVRCVCRPAHFLILYIVQPPQVHTWRASHHFCAEISGNCSIMYISFIMEKKPLYYACPFLKLSHYGNIECVLKGIFHSKRKISKPSAEDKLFFLFFYFLLVHTRKVKRVQNNIFQNIFFFFRRNNFHFGWTIPLTAVVI